MSGDHNMNPLTMTDQELIEHASKQVQALRMALDMIECEKYDRRHVRWAIIDALKEEPAAPVQEPVAWRFDQAKYRENDLRGRQWAFNVFSQTKPYMDEMVQNVTPLYTTPPAAQRPWVGLTDDEVGNLSDFAYANDEEFVRNVEKHLKEKNSG